MIQLRMLGAVELRSAEGNELRSILSQPKRVALLAYLAVSSTRGYQRRDALLGMFWPELDEEHARAALNSAIYHLRRSLGHDAIISLGEELRLSDSVIAWDTAAFERALRAGEYAIALELYRGDLLESWFVDNSPEFDFWLANERLRLRTLAIDAARQQASIVSDRPSEAVLWLRRASALAPDDETLVRDLIASLQGAGDRAGALRVFEDFAARTRQEFNTPPAAETLQLIQAVRDAEPKPRTVAAARNSADAPPFVTATRRLARPRSLFVLLFALAVSGIAFIALRHTDAPLERVLVASFENRTGRAVLDPIGEMSADWIASGVARTGVADIADRAAAAALLNTDSMRLGSSGTPDWLTVAERIQARLLLTGAYYLHDGELQIQAKLYDVPGREIVSVFDPVSAPPESALAAIHKLQDRAASAVSIALDNQLYADGSFGPPRYDAYLEYLAGDDLIAQGDYAAARIRFMTASALDSTFAAAAVKAAIASIAVGEVKTADSLLVVVGRATERLVPVDRLAYNMLLAGRQGDMQTKMSRLRELARRAPESRWAYLLALHALAEARPREAANMLAALNPEGPALRGSYIYWYAVGMALHAQQKHRAELRAAARGLDQYPRNTAVFTARLRALVALGRIKEVRRELDEMKVPEWGPADWNHGQLLAIITAELDGHGHTQAASEARAKLQRWYNVLPADRKDYESPRFGLTWTLYMGGLWRELETRASSRAAAEPHDLRWPMLIALAAAQRGDTVTARNLEQRITALPEESLSASGVWPADRLVWRAKLSALLRDSDAAVNFLRQAATRGRAYYSYYHIEPAFSGVRKLPAFQAIITPHD